MVKSHVTINKKSPQSLALISLKTEAQNLFGTGGIRGLFGTEPLTIPSLIKLGLAIEQWAHATLNRPPVILLAADTRESAHLIKSALQVGLLASGSTIYDAQILPTPVVCQLVHNNNTFDLGIIISASHNPYQDNGIKIINGETGKFTIEDEKQISALFKTQEIQSIAYNTPGTVISNFNAADEYKKNIFTFFPPLFLKNKKIVLDCAHGATSAIAQNIFEHFGAHIIAINNTPTGKNINDNCGSVHPEQLQDSITTHNADIGFAFDGDGDRVIIATKHGVLKDGDDILALLSTHPVYAQKTAVVATIMSNQGLVKYLKTNNKNVLRTNVGEKYVLARMEQEEILLGGEQNGHIILRDYMNYGDGIFNALRVLECLQLNNNWNMETFTKFPQILINIPINVKKDLSSPPLATLIAEYEAQLHDGRLVVRYSGTELLLRIMVEDSDVSNARAVGTHLSKELAQHLSFNS